MKSQKSFAPAHPARHSARHPKGPLQSAADANTGAGSLAALQRMADAKAPAQRMQDDEMQGKFIQRVVAPIANRTGLPDALKAGVENLSGMSLDHVKVHRNSAKPAAVQAHAYAQGSEIHLGPGQEKHLPHEAWHVVQQAQGRVKPTTQLKGVAVNDDAGLEKEADVMGAKALQMVAHPKQIIQTKCAECESENELVSPPLQSKAVKQLYTSCRESSHYTDAYHNWIQQQYKSRISATGKREYSVKDGSNWRFVDIADTRDKEVYEIKAIAGQAGAQDEAKYYRDLLNSKRCGTRGVAWTLGTPLNGFRSTPHRGNRIVVRFPEDGVITYELEQVELSDAESLSDEESQSDESESDSS